MSKNYFIPKAINPEHKGFLRRMLRIPADEKIPPKFLNVIIGTPINRVAKNPTKIGVRQIKVTRLVHERALLAQTLIGFRQQKKAGFSTRNEK